MSLRAIRLALALLPLPPAAASAQRGEAPSSVVRHVLRLTTEDGLAENNLRAVLRDSTGFIWTLTRSGIAQRYDGRTFVELGELTGSAELARSVNQVFVDGTGALWFFAGRQLTRLDRDYEVDLRVPLDSAVSVATLSADGRFWFFDGDALKTIETTGRDSVARTLTRYSLEVPLFMSTDSRGRLWLGATAREGLGVFRIDPATLARTRFPAPRLEARGITEDSHGRIWLNSLEGLAVLAPGASAFRVVPEFRSRRTTVLAPDESGAMIVATDDWLARIDSTGAVAEYLTSPDAFSRNALLNGITTDPDGGAWLATTTAGLLRLQTRQPTFTFLSKTSTPPLPIATSFITALWEQDDGSMLVGTLNSGAYRLTPDWREARRIPLRTGRSASTEYDVWDFEEDSDGRLWAAAAGGICRLASGAFRCFTVAGGVVDIERTPDGWFWLANYASGVRSFDPQREQFREQPVHVAALSVTRPVAALFSEADSGFLWMGLGEILLRTRVANGVMVDTGTRFAAPITPGDLVYDFHRDRQGNLLAGTGGGLLRRVADSAGNRFVLAHGLEPGGTTIFSIAEDSAGRIWLGSGHGLVQYSPTSASARRYGRRDNFFSGELNRRAALLRRNGNLVFGGVDGLTEFDPQAVIASRVTGRLVFTRWSRMTTGGAIGSARLGAPPLRVEPGDRAFTIEFAELSYAPNPARRFRYRLEGLSHEWVETTEHSATYAAPPPGRYEFRVQSASGGGDAWSTPGTSVTIDVAPPFWNTSWFKLAVFLSLALLIWLAHRWRVQQAVVTERLRLRIARDLHDEIGAGLSSIALLSDRAGVSPSEQDHLRRIGESARSMVADLRDIVWAIDPEADRARDVEGRMRDLASSLLHDISVTFDFRANDGQLGMETRRDLLLMYKEILHNVAKHARATEATIALHINHDQVELVVTDNGTGFTPNGTHPGTGLKSLRERASRLGGDLEIDSAPGRGSIVRFIRGRGTQTRRAGDHRQA